MISFEGRSFEFAGPRFDDGGDEGEEDDGQPEAVLLQHVRHLPPHRTREQVLPSLPKGNDGKKIIITTLNYDSGRQNN